MICVVSHSTKIIYIIVRLGMIHDGWLRELRDGLVYPQDLITRWAPRGDCGWRGVAWRGPLLGGRVFVENACP